MRAILAAAEQIAASDVCALIIGEKGTGKELLAHHIHALSAGAAGPFVRIDCQEVATHRPADPHAALEQNGAAGTLAGALERARGGTLFLDHLTAFGTDVQTRVLAALVADTRAVRLIAACDPLESPASCLTLSGLALVEIPVPSLRQRRSDIPVLVEYFLARYATRHGAGACSIETEAMVQLWQYDWPGNVRELESVIERVVVLSRSGIIRTADLPQHICTVKGRAGGARRNGHSAGALALRPA